jgi:MSHA biogenesis protein MshK
MADGMTSEDRGRKTEDRCAVAAALRLFARISLFCLLPSVLYPLNAEELHDPTRPPTDIYMPVVAGEAAPLPAGLQSIIISKTRRAAIIDGETVELGGKYGDAKLIEVNRGGVVLRGAQGRQVLTLFPDVKITATKVPAGNNSKSRK